MVYERAWNSVCNLFYRVGREYGMKEPKIAQMDWRSLGYWPVWKDGKKVWVPKDDKSFDKDTEN
jgi:hypothetical protein